MILSLVLVSTGTLHLVHGLLERQSLHRLVVDLGDQVARQDAGLRRRRVVHRRDHLDQAVLHRDLDAEPAELALGGLLHVAPGLVVHVARMRVERGDHAVDRAFDQLGVVGLLDVVGPDPLEHLAEQIELRIGVAAPAPALAAAIQCAPCGAVTRRVRQAPAAAPRKNRKFLRIDSRTFSLSIVARLAGQGRICFIWARRRSHNTFLVSLRPFSSARSRAWCRIRAWRGCRANSRTAAGRCGTAPRCPVSRQHPSASSDY